MVLLPNNQDLTAGSGIINIDFLEQIYHSFMDEALEDLGGNRGQVIFHLKPEVQQDTVTQSQPAPQQYNPFFGRTPVPQTNTRNAGVRISPRDVMYTAHIRIGPIKADEDTEGIGDLLDNEAMITVVIEALRHIEESISCSIEGRRYSIENTRPGGFSKRRYVLVKLKEIQETEPPTPDITIG
jgi:hypothetical protein